jgi:hypothetical protein
MLNFQPTSPPSSISFYRVNTTSGNTCILIRTDGLLSIQYRDKLNEDKEADVYLPDNPQLSGVCDNSDESQVTLSFKGFVITMYFVKTPGKQRHKKNHYSVVLHSTHVHTHTHILIFHRWWEMVRKQCWTHIFIVKSPLRACRSTKSQCEALNTAAHFPLCDTHRKIIWVHARTNYRYVCTGMCYN